MGKKKKHRKWKKSKPQEPQNTHKPEEDSKGGSFRGMLAKPLNNLVIGVIVLVVIIAMYYLIESSGLLRQGSTIERRPFPGFSSEASFSNIEYDDFVGSDACASCHNDIYQLWKNSTHGRAGGLPTPDNVIGKFDAKGRKFQDAVMTPFVTSDREYMFKIEPKGLPDRTYKVHAVVGGGHMVGGGTQTYFTQMPDGTVRFLPYDFHRGQQVWFGELTENQGWVPITKERPLDREKEYFPSRVLGFTVTMDNCQQCHGSQIMLNYDNEKKKYETRYKSLSINCESCHGPGKRHVELMQLPNRDTLHDIGMRPLVTLTKDESLNVCFSCHALKDFLNPGFLPGKDLETHYALKFPAFTSNSFLKDGRVRKFGYQQNHLYSDCYLNGSMTCVDCHDPHSQSYRDINGKILSDRFDDGQCTSCHASKAVNPVKHTYHKKESPGSKCVSCHMPYLEHKATGDQLTFARSDHTIPIPRPVYDTEIGIENACYKCHQDRTIEWLQAKTEEWYGELKPHDQSTANLNEYHSGMDRITAARLLLNDSSNNSMGQMASLGLFARNHLSPDMENLEPEIVKDIKRYIESMDMNVRSLALAGLHLARDNDTEIHNYLVSKLEEIKAGEQLKVRARWAHSMPYLALNYEQEGDFDKAISINRKALQVQPENVNIIMNLARLYEFSGDSDNAIKYYSEVIRIDENNAQAWLYLGNNYMNKNDTSRALACYRKAREINPWLYDVHVNIGNHYDRIGENESAIASYKKAIEVDPRIANTYFYLAMSFLKSKNRAEALETVKKGLYIDPENRTGKQILRVLEAQ